MMEVISRGERGRAERTDFDTVTFAGTVAYLYRVRAMREIYCPGGWSPWLVNGLEAIRSSDKTIGVVTRGGDATVGFPESRLPQPKGEVGDGASVALGQMSLFEATWFKSVGLAEGSNCGLWMLLVNAFSGVIRAELSLATEIDESGRVSDWLERIILPAFDPDDPEGWMRGDTNDSENSSEIIDVPVIRKK
jgi:hypothetical protein